MTNLTFIPISDLSLVMPLWVPTDEPKLASLHEPIGTLVAQIDWYQSGTYALFAIVLGVLLTATLVSTILTRRGSIESTLLRRFRHKLQIWWLMVAIFAIGFLLHRTGVVVLFGLVSFWALREFITMTPTRRGDHRTLFWVFFIFTPLQYLFVGLGNHPPDWAGGEGVDYYDYYSILIPVYASLFIPARAALAGDHKRFLERSAKIQFGLLVCVYSLSYAPALLDLDLQDSSGKAWTGSTVTLLIFFVLIAQLATVFERLWGRLAGRTVIAEKINASRTWEGFLGSMVTTGLAAAAFAWATPFLTWEAGILGAVIAVMALAGTLTMSAIKRDRGVTDTGTLVQGHSGVLDQIDNMCFAAPVFYHFTRFFWSA